MTQAGPETALRDLLEYACTLICNAGGGSWERESAGWQKAAAKFCEQYHTLMAAVGPPGDRG